jgi:hypothetical protein
MDWNKLGAIGSLIGGLFGFGSFAAMVWPYPQIKAWRARTIGQQANKAVVPKLIAIPVAASLLLSLFSIYSAWHPQQAPNLIVQWGSRTPNLAYMVVDSSSIAQDKGKFKLLLICRAFDASIDQMRDTHLAVSGEYEIAVPFVEMQTQLNQDFMQRQVRADGWIDLYLVEVPEKVMPQQINMLNGLDALDGKILAGRSYQGQVGHITLPPK